MIEARNVSKRYGPDVVLDGASLTASPGEVTLLTGGNGSGKTTLLHILVGLRQPDSGTVSMNGERMSVARQADWKSKRSKLGFMPQDLRFPDHERVDRLVQFYTDLRGTSSDRAHEWLTNVDLLDHQNSRVGELSGGMKQRLGLALTLVHDPEYLVLDEPGNNLDPVWRERVREWLRSAARESKTVLLTSQLHEEWDDTARRLICRGDRVVRPDAGESLEGKNGRESRTGFDPQATNDRANRSGKHGDGVVDRASGEMLS